MERGQRKERVNGKKAKQTEGQTDRQTEEEEKQLEI